MSWPSPTDYQEALQSPSSVFSDLQLRQSQVEFDKLGLPRPISGNFATVFELSYAGKSWAVRCFLREVKGQKSRYDAISKYLRQQQIPSMVGFEYIPQGIRIRGQLYPIVKMEWVRGRRLDSYIEENLYRPQKLHLLAVNWQNLVLQLRKASIAHGDLQHGNIVVDSNDAIRLVDYDGMYVPGTIGIPSNEIGHRNYQHPSRTSDLSVTSVNFLGIDNFSTWIIGISIRLLQLDPSLWSKTQAGDDCLLFKSEDFRNPANSTILHLLRTHRDQLVRDYAQKLISILECPSYLEIPVMSLEVTSENQPKSSNLADWFRDYVPREAEQLSSKGNSSWVNDHIEPEKPSPKFEFPLEFLLEEKERIQTEYQNLSLTERVRSFYFNFGRYLEDRVKTRFSSYPIIIQRNAAYSMYKRLEHEKTLLETDLQTLETAYQTAHKAAQKKHDLEFRVRQSEQRLYTIENALRLLKSQEEYETTALRENYLRTNLKFCVLKPGMVPGIGKVRIEHLNRIGIYSAFEIEPSRRNQVISIFRGIYKSDPTAEWDALVHWRSVLEGQYLRYPGLSSSIRNAQINYAAKRSNFDNEKRQILTDIDASRQQISQIQQGSIDHLRKTVEEGQNKLRELEQRINKARRYCARYSRITEANLIEQLRKV